MCLCIWQTKILIHDDIFCLIPSDGSLHPFRVRGFHFWALNGQETAHKIGPTVLPLMALYPGTFSTYHPSLRLRVQSSQPANDRKGRQHIDCFSHLWCIQITDHRLGLWREENPGQHSFISQAMDFVIIIFAFCYSG